MQKLPGAAELAGKVYPTTVSTKLPAELILAFAAHMWDGLTRIGLATRMQRRMLKRRVSGTRRAGTSTLIKQTPMWNVSLAHALSAVIAEPADNSNLFPKIFSSGGALLPIIFKTPSRAYRYESHEFIGMPRL